MPDRLLAVGLLSACAVGCGSVASPAPSGAGSRPAPTVRRAAFQPRVLLTGELKAIEAEPILVPETPNWQMPIRWMEGDGVTVVAEQKVLELDNTQFTGNLEERRLAESSALNRLMQKEADLAVELADRAFALEQARVRLARARIEADVPEALRSRHEHQAKQLAREQAEVAEAKAAEDLQAARRASDAELEELRIALDKARHDVRIAEEAIAALIVRAPRDGILVVAENRRENRKYQIGDDVWVGLAVMEIPDLSAMKVEALLSDVDDGRIAVGQRALCALDTYPDRTFPGRVVDITPVAKEQGWQSMRRAFRAVIRLDEADPERMRPGMSVQVEVDAEPVADALIVPRGALDLSVEPPRALLAGGASVEVLLGPCSAAECVIERGLEDDSRLRWRG
jgi:multidrug resistance efflux pump